MIKKVYYTIKEMLIEFKSRAQWKKMNQHNYTTIRSKSIDKVSVGNYTYGRINHKYYYNKEELIEVGSFCSIADDVIFLSGGGHNLNTFSTYPFKAYFSNTWEASTKGPIIVHDDVWIGHSCMILSGVTIGQGAVIGAGSIVSKDIPPYAIYAGGRIIRYRFSDEIIEKLLKFDYSKLTREDVEKNIELLYKPIDESFFETQFYKEHLK